VDDMLVRVHETPNSLSSGNFQDQLVYTLPMICRHLERQRDELAPREADSILGDRLGRLGRSALGRGLRREGASLIMRAVRLGNHPVKNIFLLLRAAVPMGWIKRLLGR